MVELYLLEPTDELLNQINKELKICTLHAESLEVQTLLNGKYDSCNAIVTIHSGSGGTESQDWAEMLLRMYLRFAERNNFSVEITDEVEGQEAGIKSVEFTLSGNYAYGMISCEKGVHRLVRISPFDANSRRHTSFASVEVVPIIENANQVEINPEDIRVDTYRASGAGGQHINKTDSAVRLTHLPTVIVVTSQSQRSQIQNKEKHMKI